MIKFECSREAETIRAAWSNQWPEGCDQDLVRHAAECRLCSQAVELARMFRDEREAACHEAGVPPSGLVWWKAQLRARQEAAQAASRPILVAQLVAVLSLLGAALVISARLLGPARTALDAVAAIAPRPSLTLPALDPAVFMHPGILLVCAAALVLTPIAVYLAIARD